jgi:heme-degrading monooxygenase HmoA
MIGILVHQFAREGAESDGVRLIQTSGEAMKSFPGFKSRYTMVSRNDKQQISTVTFWESHDAYVRWTQSDVNRSIVRPPGIWTSKPEPTFFDVIAA